MTTGIIIHGSIDDDSEGNYTLDITAKAGRNEIQKTNIFRVNKDITAEEEDDDDTSSLNTSTGEIIRRNNLSVEPDILSGGLNVPNEIPSNNGDTGGNDITSGTLSPGNITGASYLTNGIPQLNSAIYDGEFDVSSGTVNITRNGTYRIYGSSTNSHISVGAGVRANIYLDNVYLTVPEEQVFDMRASIVKLYLIGDNTLIGPGICAGINASGGSTLTIDGSGSLYAKGGYYASGIGGGGWGDGGNITILGGRITAEGGHFGAGIGCGLERGGGTITIKGSEVIAKGGYGAAGIGGGLNGSGGNITISGGTVTATGGEGAAGIGGGVNGSGGNVTISGGTVTATGGDSGAGIGGGWCGAGGTITINGGTVNATGGYGAAGIGGGEGGSSGTIRIQNGLIASGNVTASSIGAGNNGINDEDDIVELDANLETPSDDDYSQIQAGDVADGSTTLRNILQFYDSDGNFL